MLLYDKENPMKKLKQKRTYRKDTVKRISYTISADVKKLRKILDKLQVDVDALRKSAKVK